MVTWVGCSVGPSSVCTSVLEPYHGYCLPSASLIIRYFPTTISGNSQLVLRHRYEYNKRFPLRTFCLRAYTTLTLTLSYLRDKASGILGVEGMVPRISVGSWMALTVLNFHTLKYGSTADTYEI